jgi:alpha-beta hydrolase superfamily lysophospholipase
MGFDPYWEWLQIPGDQRPPNHYELLGVSPFEADAQRLRAAYRERYALVRKYKIGTREEDAERLIDELSQAHDCLSRSESREQYEQELRSTFTVTTPATSGPFAGADPADRRPPAISDARSDSDTPEESARPPVESERVPPPPPPPEIAAADSDPSASPPRTHLPSRFDSWHRLSAPEKWFVASVGLSGVAVVVLAVVVGVVVATGTGGDANELAKMDEARPRSVALSGGQTAPSPDETEVLTEYPMATNGAGANGPPVPAGRRRGSSILDADASGRLDAAPTEKPEGVTTATVTLPNGDPGAEEIVAGTQPAPVSEPGGPTLVPAADRVDDPGMPGDAPNAGDPVGKPLDKRLTEGLPDLPHEAPVTAELEPPVASGAVAGRALPEAGPDAGGHSPTSPESVKLAANDGAQIHCTWYPSPKAAEHGKEVVPVIVVHGWGEERSMYDALARSLQSQGHAVIVPDLRGHGSSTVILTPVESRELPVEIRADTMKVDGKVLAPSDALSAIVRYDLEAVKEFLIAKNNAAEVNIQLLCLVASEAGSVVALNWAAANWTWLPPPMGSQGGHVKAVALLSPAMGFRGVSLQQTLANHVIRDRLAVTIIVGEHDSGANREARQLYAAFNRTRPAVRSRDTIRKQDLMLVDVDSHLQGANLLGVDAFEVDKKIASFIQLRLVNRRHMHPWEDPRQ